MNLLQTVYNLTDAYFLGKLGPLELVVPTVVWPFMFIFISLAAGFSHAGTSIVAQYTDMEDIRLAEKSAAQTILSVLVVSLGIMAVAIGFTDFFLSIVNVEGEIYDLAKTYFRTIVAALPFIFLMQITAGIYRGWGNSIIALIFMSIAVSLNIILDPIFIFVMDMGVIGAAIGKKRWWKNTNKNTNNKIHIFDIIVNEKKKGGNFNV